mgnify:CR=1 FL=1
MSKTIRRTIDPKVLKGHPPLNKSPRAIMEPRMDTNGWEETTKHTKGTKGTKGKFRTTNGHEWVGGNHETHERHEREIQNHEWTRMDTNGWEGATKHTKGTKGTKG